MTEVSVIVPARDAAATLGATLASLLAQTLPNWEAIVVDDGSADGTAEVVAAVGDPRIRVERTPGLGVSSARNLGIGLARAPWLLFLDADDWIEPRYLERMTAAALEGGDGALCGWRLAAPDGRLGPERRCPEDRALFELLATQCPFAVHACLVRRDLVEVAGGFDRELRTCEEWDLWQRIARAGARFARVPEALAVYRMRPGSASLGPGPLLADGLRVIERGHGVDPRVSAPTPAWAGGRDRRGLPAARFLFACWAAGLALGRGEEALPLLDALSDTREPGLDPEAAARNLFQAALLPGARLPEEWIGLWPEIESPLDVFLRALEERSGAGGIALRTRRTLERLTIEASGVPRSFTVGTTHNLRLEVTEPIGDVPVPPCVELLRAVVTAEGEVLGTVELPVIGGQVPAAVLADAVAADHAWEILRRFLAPRAPGRFGWDLFLQELWGRPGWPMSTFYDPAAVREEASRRHAGGDLEIEVAAELPEVEAAGPVDALLRVGGAAVGRVPLPGKRSSARTSCGRRSPRQAVSSSAGSRCARRSSAGRSRTPGVCASGWRGPPPPRSPAPSPSAARPERRSAPAPAGGRTSPPRRSRSCATSPRPSDSRCWKSRAARSASLMIPA